jgi:hypothetical protein
LYGAQGITDVSPRWKVVPKLKFFHLFDQCRILCPATEWEREEDRETSNSPAQSQRPPDALRETGVEIFPHSAIVDLHLR